MALLQRRLAFGRVAWIEVVCGHCGPRLGSCARLQRLRRLESGCRYSRGSGATMLMGYLMSAGFQVSDFAGDAFCRWLDMGFATRP